MNDYWSKFAGTHLVLGVTKGLAFATVAFLVVERDVSTERIVVACTFSVLIAVALEFGLLYSLDRRKHEALLAKRGCEYKKSFETALEQEGAFRLVMLRWISKEFDRNIGK